MEQQKKLQENLEKLSRSSSFSSQESLSDDLVSTSLSLLYLRSFFFLLSLSLEINEK